jgi:hypothetical protein
MGQAFAETRNIVRAAAEFENQKYYSSQLYASERPGVPSFEVALRGWGDGVTEHRLTVRSHDVTIDNNNRRFVEFPLEVADKAHVTGLSGEIKLFYPKPNSSELSIFNYTQEPDSVLATLEEDMRESALQVGLPITIDWMQSLQVYADAEADGSPLTAEYIFDHPLVAA